MRLAIQPNEDKRNVRHAASCRARLTGQKCGKETWSLDQEDVIELVKLKMDVAVENRIEAQGDSRRIKQDNKNLMQPIC